MLGQDCTCNESLCCINAYDTNKTLETTFRFILEHQINPDDSINYTNIFLGQSSLKSLTLSDPTNREVAFNLISGTVKKVSDSYVVILAKSACVGKLDEFIIAFSDIDSFNSLAITKYFSEYILALEKLPPICVDCHNSYYNILQALKLKLDELKNTVGLDIFLIYANIFSQSYSPSFLTIVRNLVVFGDSGVIPITSVGGFFTVPSIDLTKEEGGAL